MTEKLKNNIENLYKVFEKYGATNMTGSPLYDDLTNWNKEIFSKPLRELDEDNLSRFTGKAITSWGDTNDYKHFLPRIFELTAELKTPYEIWIAFDRLSLAEWQNWDEQEQNVIKEYMIALWENILNDNSEKAELEFQDYFSAIAHFYSNFTVILEIWSTSESKAGIKHLANLVVNEKTSIFERKKITGFYDKTENVDELINWILSDKIYDKIQRKFFEFETENFAEKISWAEQIITIERKSTAHNRGLAQ
jgi:hypothetical protein